ncbi:MAG: translocation/assembly module TamB domain-containing protein, partial [Candidatus Omnitrophica bacterium]|nr:translocation/assembly module TamB domain-containing protein [Candidatus Omnitrophota bacterium]
MTVFSVAAIAAAAGYYLITSTQGARALVDYALMQSARFASVTAGSTGGAIGKGLVLKNVEIRNWPLLGPAAVIRLQRVEVRLPLLLDWRKIQVNVFNGRLDLPQCDPAIFSGRYIDGSILGNAYGRVLDVSVIMKPFLPAEYWRNLRGQVSNADLTIQGPVNGLQVRGHFYVDRIQYGTMAVREGLARVNVEFKQERGQWRMHGPVMLESGSVNVRRSTIELRKSRASFKGDLLNPALAIYGTAKADVYTIDVAINGTLRNPQVRLRADPYLAEDMAMMVLGLGNWAPSDFSAQYNTGADTGANRMGLRKKLSDDLNVGFELEQLPARPGRQQSSGYSKQLEGELSITDKFSLNIEEKILPEYADEKDPAA